MNLTRNALRKELWGMLTDEAKKAMLPVKESYIDSLMADIDSYALGIILNLIKDTLRVNNAISLEKTTNNRFKLKFIDGAFNYFKSIESVMTWALDNYNHIRNNEARKITINGRKF